MAFATINYYSHSLERGSAFNVIFPDSPDAKRPWGVYYLLHGLSDDHTTWCRRSCVERYVLGYRMMIVMPNGGRSWYTNTADGDPYEDDLMTQVIGMVEKNFPVRAERSGRAIGGVSMGGFGAVKLALKHPDVFASADSQSGVLGLLRDPAQSKLMAREFTRIFGDAPTDGPEDPYRLAAELRPRKRPALRIVSGEEDPFVAQNRAFHEHLMSLQFEHQYEEHPGTHNWEFWTHHLRSAIDFHRHHLGIPDDPIDAVIR